MTWVTWVQGNLFLNSSPCLHCLYSGLGLRKTGPNLSVHKTTSPHPASSEAPTQLVTKRRARRRPGHWLPYAQPLSGLGGREALPLSLISVLLDLVSVYMMSGLSLNGLGFLKSKANYRLLFSLPLETSVDQLTAASVVIFWFSLSALGGVGFEKMKSNTKGRGKYQIVFYYFFIAFFCHTKDLGCQGKAEVPFPF